MPDTHHAYEHLQGIYFPIAIAVFAVVFLGVAALIITGARRSRPAGRSEILSLELLYASGLAAVAAFLVWSTFRAETPVDRVLARPALRIQVTAGQWSWRFRYPNGLTVAAVATWHPSLALVPTGVPVEFDGISEDVIHGFWVPQLRFQRQLLPGHVTRFDLIFHDEGLYGGVCSVYCGEQHAEMHFELEAVSPGAFRQWLAGERRGS
jgi:cytochrome c oxidase subunit 2